MFGTYRFILASFVVAIHLFSDMPEQMGWYAVFGFYTLSGYLMTLVLNEQYGFSHAGIWRFTINRLLRIYPAYWICAGIATVCVAIVPWLPFQLWPMVIMPVDFLSWLPNIFIFGHFITDKARLVPQSWSLYVELVFYILMALLLARNKLIVSVWFVVSLVWTIYANMGEMRFMDRYFTIPAGSLPFSIGAVIYFYRNELMTSSRFTVSVSILLFAVNLIISYVWEDLGRGLYFYLSIFLGTVLLINLRNVDSKDFPVLTKVDKFLGDLSYPMYVSHVTAGVLVLWAFWPNVPRHRGWDFFLLGYGYTIIFSYAIHRYVERPIESLRRRIKLNNGIRSQGLNIA
jgi:peptidoglycan/LPS O-acetylase OafA/YrhL